MVVLGISSSLSGHSTGAWLVRHTCGTLNQAFIFVSTYHSVGTAAPTEGVYIDRNQDGQIRNKANIDKVVCSLDDTQGLELSGVATTSTDYYPMDSWIAGGALPLTNFSDPGIFTIINQWLHANKGIDTLAYTITPIWTPSPYGAGGVASFMVIDFDVTTLSDGITSAHVATTGAEFTPY